jgi:hypothetical protein
MKETIEIHLHLDNFNRDMRSLGCSWNPAAKMTRQGRAIKMHHEEESMTSNIGSDA